MKIKIDTKTYEYLLKNIFPIEAELIDSIKMVRVEEYIVLELNEDTASLIKDFAGELLQKKGFDKNYNLTSDGEILEKIEDLFYTQ